MIAPEANGSRHRLASASRGVGPARPIREAIIAPPGRGAAARRMGRPLREALMNEGPPDRLPASIIGLLTRIRRTDRALRRELGRPPTFEEVAASLGLSEAQKATVLRILGSLPRRPLRSGAPGDDEPVLLLEDDEPILVEDDEPILFPEETGRPEAGDRRGR